MLKGATKQMQDPTEPRNLGQFDIIISAVSAHVAGCYVTPHVLVIQQKCYWNQILKFCPFQFHLNTLSDLVVISTQRCQFLGALLLPSEVCPCQATCSHANLEDPKHQRGTRSQQNQIIFWRIFLKYLNLKFWLHDFFRNMSSQLQDKVCSELKKRSFP